MSQVMAFALALSFVVVLSLPAEAAEVDVATLPELQEALRVAQAGDVINITNVKGFLAVSGELTIPRGVTVNNEKGSYFIVNGELINLGTLNNHDAIVIQDKGSIRNYGFFTNYDRIYNDNDGVIFNDRGFFNKGSINNGAVIENYGIIINDEYLLNRGIIYNFGSINNYDGNISNEGLIKNSADITTGLFYNSGGVIENYCVIYNIGHFNNRDGIVNIYGKLANDQYFYNVDGTVNNYGDGVTGPDYAFWEGNDMINHVKAYAEVSASVLKLTGNQNLLTITITEYSYYGSMAATDYRIMINNNAAGTYKVGEYKVYVDTKGNTQIRACYFVE